MSRAAASSSLRTEASMASPARRDTHLLMELATTAQLPRQQLAVS
uniref:Uncharacterized protein n=1 Tax=Arundo donax TaxID=35708 RepID=A0A0A9BV12_ARUDO